MSRLPTPPDLEKRKVLALESIARSLEAIASPARRVRAPSEPDLHRPVDAEVTRVVPRPR